MRPLILLFAILLAAPLAAAQPAGSGAAAGSAAPAAGSDAAGSGSAAAATPAPQPTPAPTASPAPNAADLRKTCADAMNADPTFAQAIVETINADTARQHAKAADAIATNEKHVILAYAAMWLIAAAFVLFLWRRQQRLTAEIANLKRDLEAASK